MTVSIKDVAKQAGVAIGTVSRVFNHYPDVLPETRDKVLAAARAMNYSPNVSARSLSAKKPPNICLIGMEMISGGDLNSPLSQHLMGVLKYARDHSLELSLLDVDPEEQNRMSFADYCSLHTVSGAIITGIRTDDPYFEELMTTDLSVVGIDLPLEGENTGWVSVDNRAAAREAMLGMIDKCGGDILIVEGRRNAAVNDARILGIADALALRGLPFTDTMRLPCDFEAEPARINTLSYLETCPPPRGIFCLSDLMATGVLKALREKGLRVSKDVRVMGFDGMGYTQLLTPPLSTVAQDFRAVGYEAAALLHSLMQGKKTEKHRVLPHKILWRESTD